LAGLLGNNDRKKHVLHREREREREKERERRRERRRERERESTLSHELTFLSRAKCKIQMKGSVLMATG